MTAPQVPVALHVGGLTTGGEDFVVYLAANRAGLRRAGFGLYCFDPAGTGRDSLAAVMPEPQADDAAIDTAALEMQRLFAADRKAGSAGFLVSAADLPGPVSDLMLGRFYPAARTRARALRRALGQPVDRLVLSIQPYAELFHATWLSLAADRPMDPFADYAEAMARFSGGWAELAEALTEELEVRELRVIADPVGVRPLLSHLCPGTLLRQPVQPLPRPRMTESAAAMMQRCMAQGTRLQPGQRDRLIAFHARQPQHRHIGGFSALALADLHGRYVADLDAIEATANVTLVGRTLPAMAAE